MLCNSAEVLVGPGETPESNPSRSQMVDLFLEDGDDECFDSLMSNIICSQRLLKLEQSFPTPRENACDTKSKLTESPLNRSTLVDAFLANPREDVFNQIVAESTCADPSRSSSRADLVAGFLENLESEDAFNKVLEDRHAGYSSESASEKEYSEDTSAFACLPEEIIEFVLGFLDWQSLSSFSMTSSYFRTLASSEALWEALYRREYDGAEGLKRNEIQRGLGTAEDALFSWRDLFRISRSWSVQAWGNNFFGQLGDGTKECRSYPSAVGLEIMGSASIASVACGGAHAAIITEQGRLFMWGANSYGQCGDEDAPYVLEPSPVEALDGLVISKVELGGNFSCVVNTQSYLYSFGSNAAGESGVPYLKEVKNACPLMVSGDIVSLACGAKHIIAMKTDGSVVSWGSNEYGQLGRQLPIDDDEAHRHPGTILLPGVTAVAAGGSHSAAVSEHGQLYIWGSGGRGQLGRGMLSNHHEPELVQGLEQIESVALGCIHTVAKATSGRVYSWGSGQRGQLGHPANEPRLRPMEVEFLRDKGVIGVQCGAEHSVFVTEKCLYACGFNDSGQLGLAHTYNQSLPRRLVGFLDVDMTQTAPKLVACGDDFTVMCGQPSIDLDRARGGSSSSSS